jgi:hypothetical protein
MSEEQLADLGLIIEEWQTDEEVSDSDLAAALRTLAADYQRAPRCRR